MNKTLLLLALWGGVYSVRGNNLSKHRAVNFVYRGVQMAVKASLPFGTEFTPQRWLKSQTGSLLVLGLYNAFIIQRLRCLREPQDGAKQSDGAKEQAFIKFARDMLPRWVMNFVLEVGISKLAHCYPRIDLFLQRPLTTCRVTAVRAIVGCLYFQLRRVLEQRSMLAFQRYWESRSC